MLFAMNRNENGSRMDANMVASSTCDAKKSMTSSHMANIVNFSGTAFAVSVLFLLALISLLAMELISISLIIIMLIIISIKTMKQNNGLLAGR